MKNSKSLSCFIAIILALSNLLFADENIPRLYINEFMASNLSTILSRDHHEYTDWIEIHNNEDSTVNIGGYYLTDDLDDPYKWQIPEGTKIAWGKRALFWADGYNEGKHTNFKLSKEGEEIGLYSPDGVLIDSIVYSKQITDVSFGRFPNAGSVWQLFDNPTPGTVNDQPGYLGITDAPKFLTAGGLYSGSQSVILDQFNPFVSIRYTVDGSVPTHESTVYDSEIELNSTTVIRARSFQENYIPSDVVTQTYFIDETSTLPIISIVTEPDNLWDDEIGIYVEGTNGKPGYCVSEPRNWNQPWERPISMEMYEANGDFAFKVNAGMQIGGGCTRKYPQKPLAIYLRSKYGDSKIHYRIFDDKAIYEFNNLRLRNSGQDWWRAMFRDGMMHTLVKGQMDIDWQAYKPANLFLNGEYWGIHGVREKHNEHYIAANHGIDPDAIDILSGGGHVRQGSSEHYDNMIDYIEDHDLTSDEHYQWVEAQMDINEYLNYMISEIYFANIDWPGGNIKFWRQHGEGNKWRWILFDTDLGFGAHGYGQYDSNSLQNASSEEKTYYANPTWATFLFRSLLKNRNFRDRFVQRSAALLNTTFESERVLGIIDSLKSNIEAEIPRHTTKWTKSTSFNDGWEYHLNVMNEFAIKRPGYMYEHIMEKFDLTDTCRLYINNDNNAMGDLVINGVKLHEENFEAAFFEDIPINCVAVPKKGYRFVTWRGASISQSDTMSLVINEDSQLEAVFEIDESEVFYGLRINEVMAVNEHTHPDENNEFDDWIELYNDSREVVDIGGMYVSDDPEQPDKWQIPETSPNLTQIDPGSFVVLWADKDTDQGVLHVDFKISSSGEKIILSENVNNTLEIVDTLSLKVQTSDVSYGRSPDGSDELAYFSQATPGYGNVVTAVDEDNELLPQSTALCGNYPNPFNPVTIISLQYAEDAFSEVNVYDMQGRLVERLYSGYRNAGRYELVWDAGDMPSGIYIVRMSAGDIVSSHKIALIK